MIGQQEITVYNLNQEAKVSDWRARTMQSSVEGRMGELEERINEIRDSDMNSGITPGVIQSLSDMIMNGAPSTAVELLSQQIDELTHGICTERVLTADLRIDFSELQERVNSSILLQGTPLI